MFYSVLSLTMVEGKPADDEKIINFNKKNIGG